MKQAKLSQIDENVSGWLSPSGEIFDIQGMEHYAYLNDLYAEGIFQPSHKAFEFINQKYGYDINIDFETGSIPEYDMNDVADMAFFDGWIRFFGGNDGRWSGFKGDTINFQVWDFNDVQNLHSFVKRGKIAESVRAIFIDSNNINYKFRGSPGDFVEEGLRRKQIANKTADFGGDFQNVSDIRPSENSNPGFNKEYLKQQEDFYPRKISNDDENGEYVHLHPDHCPRPDLRKLKIVDENDDDN